MDGGKVIAFFTLLFGVAMTAIIVSQKAQTSSVIQALGTATASVLGAATAPVTGGSSSGGVASTPGS